MYRKILNVGQWYSGSSAVVDLLSEHDDVWILPDNKANKMGEFIGYRLAWIDEIARVIDHGSVQRLNLLYGNFKRNIVSATFSRSDITPDQKEHIKKVNEVYLNEVHNIFISNIQNKRIMFEYTSSLWIEMLCEITEHENIVFDQAISSYSDPNTYNKIFLHNKIIVTERNILDQITDIQMYSTFFWIVRTGGSIIDFIRQSISERQYWYNQRNKSENILIIRFEDLVFQPHQMTEVIFGFLGLAADRHNLKEHYFKPDQSQKNIGKFKDYLSSREIETVHSELEKYDLSKLATNIV